ncbi:hypothetical protein BDP55DRAFT_660315 [Colletotrichum godetiae]|uniref:Uncharacterized protein n=1 Tax=Colletotrichum godetiae TaxID=1209918 RepID=A0AAJ0EZH9_9PEZI|nr:uncharacterized protein BDP55DRAFT_660315 [Colletotrichum godetiae]KAK1687538.1 hypothetical protein BDP55DRAFT_660315 [Colletotrichum godetiae]
MMRIPAVDGWFAGKSQPVRRLEDDAPESGSSCGAQVTECEQDTVRPGSLSTDFLNLMPTLD